MKKICPLLLISLSLSSCNNNEYSESQGSEFRSKIYDSDYKPSPLLFDKEAISPKLFHIIKAQHEEYNQLLEAIDIEFPLDNFPEEERIEANEKYRSFVAFHPNEVYLPVIRSRYSKIMLVNYEILETENYAQIKYYTNELIESRSDKHELLLKCLKKLKGNVDDDEFKLLQTSAICDLAKQQAFEAAQLIKLRQKIDEMVVDFKEKGRKPSRTFVNLIEREIRKLEENTIACTIYEVETI